ncbi:DNA-binding protein D-ETS-4-like isoform X2 [Galleria mellonella]|uniref:DNA-binding protein D-ETS-4-like isoform X2 n=1 Tax=Galleria mellonella TaxID=7137 RepID=A0ABM3MJI1_GALME|nr:DNA-binding protein D-ETS-4-like isoform X2 [Galleria mellonella]
MLWESGLLEESDTMPQTVPRSGCSPPSASQGERAVPASPADIHHLLRLLGAASPPESMLHSPPNPHTKPPPPYPEDNNVFLERLYDFEGYHTPSPSSDDTIPTVALQPASPYHCLPYNSPSVYIKEEPNRLAVPGFASPYPLSPSGSCASYGSQNHYNHSPVPQHEEYIDIEELLKENQILQESVQQNYITPKIEVEEPRDHILLRSALEDTTFQKRLNLKPIPLELGAVKMEESSGGDETLVAPDIDRVLSMAIEQSKRDVDNTCTVLGISPDPMLWSTADVKSWVMFTLQHFNLPMVPAEYFAMDGAALVALTEDDFNQRAPQAGSTLYAQLEIWKAARHEAWRSSQWSEQQQQQQQQQQQHQQQQSTTDKQTPAGLPSVDDMSDDEDSESAGTSSGTAGGKAKSGSTHIHLWQFLKELLASPHIHGSAIRWLDRSNGVFKIEDSVRVARLWGKRKNRPAMNYDKLSRSIRQYYKKGIMKKTERSQRLVYQFCHPYSL